MCVPVCGGFSLCVFVFLHRFGVNKCGFMIRAQNQFSKGKKRLEEGKGGFSTVLMTSTGLVCVCVRVYVCAQHVCRD